MQPLISCHLCLVCATALSSRDCDPAFDGFSWYHPSVNATFNYIRTWFALIQLAIASKKPIFSRDLHCIIVRGESELVVLDSHDPIQLLLVLLPEIRKRDRFSEGGCLPSTFGRTSSWLR